MTDTDRPAAPAQPTPGPLKLVDLTHQKNGKYSIRYDGPSFANLANVMADAPQAADMARLFTAAPELLDALQAMLADCAAAGVEPFSAARARAAIAAAQDGGTR